nr:pilot protein for DNA ejection [Microvirus sp.]
MGAWGQSSNTTSSGGSIQAGGGSSRSQSTSGTNDDQISAWLNQAYNYQNQEGNNQVKNNMRSTLMQMGYNTLGALMQGVYNHIENSAAMQYNSAEAQANRDWQERMSNTSYQRAVADMKAAGLNPILAFANGGATTPGGSSGSISGASMGLASSSALGVSRASGFVPNSYSAESWSQSDWYNAAQSWQQMLSSSQMTPYGLQKTLSEIGEQTGNVVKKAVDEGKKGARHLRNNMNEAKDNVRNGNGLNNLKRGLGK